MSQQEFLPESQYNTPRSQEQQGRSAHSWSKKRKDGERLKNEHPSTFEGTIPPYDYEAGYQAQDTQGRVAASRRIVDEKPPRQQPRSTEHAARYDARRTGRYQVPSWAAAPRINKGPLWLWTLIALLVLGLIGSIPVLLVVGVTVIGIVALAILIPLFILLAIFFTLAVVIFSVLMLLKVPLRVGPFRMGGNRWRRW